MNPDRQPLYCCLYYCCVIIYAMSCSLWSICWCMNCSSCSSTNLCEVLLYFVNLSKQPEPNSLDLRWTIESSPFIYEYHSLLSLLNGIDKKHGHWPTYGLRDFAKGGLVQTMQLPGQVSFYLICQVFPESAISLHRPNREVAAQLCNSGWMRALFWNNEKFTALLHCMRLI